MTKPQLLELFRQRLLQYGNWIDDNRVVANFEADLVKLADELAVESTLSEDAEVLKAWREDCGITYAPGHCSFCHAPLTAGEYIEYAGGVRYCQDCS